MSLELDSVEWRSAVCCVMLMLMFRNDARVTYVFFVIHTDHFVALFSFQVG